ncbi:hypothetical protein HGP28_17945 [Vibrio sp. SM6]|uniref:Uncharacterized protein n=1 Tax=Vibrio agarilyticus TaxID=2726741 RepID=A0A7X8TTU9_9VIBR|nr:hypothetical protein [Vibrio agarilyticus]NLS14744.1 hypothetical protein [Vibrio agarilyticus]
MSDLNIPQELQGTYITTSKGVEKYEVVAARNYCRNHIVKFYNESEQLNVLMSANSDEIKKMNDFIVSCRAWSNMESPTIEGLLAITP